MKKITTLLLFLIVISLLPAATAIPQPQGVGGIVYLNNVATNGLTITLINTNTGEEHVVITQKNEQNQNGFYAATFSVMKNDEIQIVATYNNHFYSNSVKITEYIPTIWLNLSIIASEPHDGGDHTPPPDAQGNHPPSANFTFLPLQPSVNDTIVFRDKSIDADKDIVSWTWTIDGESMTGKIVTYSFAKPGNHVVTLVVLDINNSMSIEQKTLFILPISNQPIPPVMPSNLTIHFQVIDKWSNKVPGAIVEIYNGSVLIATAHTNGTGIVQTVIPAGTYRIRVYYGTMESIDTYTFSNDETVVFLLAQKDTPKPPEDNTLIIAGGVGGVIAAISVILIVGRLKGWI